MLQILGLPQLPWLVAAGALLLAACNGRMLLDRRLRDAGAQCTEHYECATGRCQNDRCAESGLIPPAAKKPNGRSCTSDSDCQSRLCERSTCAAASIRDGDTCTRHPQCTSGYCEQGSCGDTGKPRPLGVPCEDKAQCGSGTCADIGDNSLCTESCTSSCSTAGIACFKGLCTPVDFCDPDSATGPGCAGSPCATCDANATCVNERGTFTCRCPTGYSGDGQKCVQNPCKDSKPCKNNGRCINDAGRSTCRCAAGFTGAHCETDVDDCTPNPCKNEGVCHDGVDTFTCVCPEHFTGDRCDIDVDDCPEDNPCNNGGVCEDGLGQFTCRCANGYEGARCAVEVDECQPNPCHAGARCTDKIASFHCACPPGYAGATCEEPSACTEDVHCATEQFCDGATCTSDVCDPSVMSCHDGQVQACLSNGSAAEILFTCPGGTHFASECQETGTDEAHCTCEDDWDCPAHTRCDTGSCLGTGTPPGCALDPAPFSDVLPAPEITWGGTPADRSAYGSPFPASAQVVMAPLVVNLDDDNEDGRIDENDFPEIVFATYCGWDYYHNGILRAIHGGGPNKGQDFFAVCGDVVWNEGNNISIDCACGDADLNSTASFAAADLDADGQPEIITIVERDDYGRAAVRIHARTGEIVATSGYHDLGENNPAVAVANLDNDGPAEIIVGNLVLTVRRNDHGQLEFQDTFRGDGLDGINGPTARQGPIACAADIRGDSRVEIVAGSAVYQLPTAPEGAESRADCDEHEPADAEQRLFCSGTLQQLSEGDKNGFCAVADVLGEDQKTPPGRDNPLDGRPEIILIADGELRIYNGQDGSLQKTLQLNQGIDGGAPNVDDFDGDGFPEIGTAFRDAYVVMDLQTSTPACPQWGVPFDRDSTEPPGQNPSRNPPSEACRRDDDCGDATSGFACNSRTNKCICTHNGWFRATDDKSSRVTGSSVFDFNGDGAAEVVYNDECRFRIYDGRNGAVLFSEPSESRTRTEYPVIADVDNDGNAEIVFGVSNESGFCRASMGGDRAQYNNGLEVWGDATDVWVSARRIWNQHAYHVTNITESAAVPLFEPHGWKSTNGRLYNSYRSNPRSFGAAPDLTITSIQLTASEGGCGELKDRVTVSLQAENKGDLRVGPGVELALFGKWGNAPFEALLDAQKAPLTITLQKTLKPGGAIYLHPEYVVGRDEQRRLPDRIKAFIDSAEQERECHEDNNTAEVPVDDPAGTSLVDLRVKISDKQACEQHAGSPASVPVVTVTVINEGSAPATNVTVRLYAGDPDQNGSHLRDVTLTGTIAANGELSSRDVSVSNFPRCTHARVFGKVNPDKDIAECNEGNNIAGQPNDSFCCDG